MNQYTRRHLLSRGLAAGAALAVPAALAGTRTAEATTALATVDMELVLLACQVDPPKAGTGLTAGCGPHVLPVEQALQATHLRRGLEQWG